VAASLPDRRKAISELKRSLRGRFGSNAHEKGLISSRASHHLLEMAHLICSRIQLL
jgi:hypothetical protein